MLMRRSNGLNTAIFPFVKPALAPIRYPIPPPLPDHCPTFRHDRCTPFANGDPPGVAAWPSMYGIAQTTLGPCVFQLHEVNASDVEQRSPETRTHVRARSSGQEVHGAQVRELSFWSRTRGRPRVMNKCRSGRAMNRSTCLEEARDERAGDRPS